MKKKIIVRSFIVIGALSIIVFFFWAIITSFGNDPFAFLIDSTLKSITVEAEDNSEQITLSERDCEVMLAVIDQVKFKKYTGEFDELKTIKGGALVTIERKLLPDIQYYTLSYIQDLKDPHNSTIALLCANGTLYTPEPGYEDLFLSMGITAVQMLPERRPKSNTGN